MWVEEAVEGCGWQRWSKDVDGSGSGSVWGEVVEECGWGGGRRMWLGQVVGGEEGEGGQQGEITRARTRVGRVREAERQREGQQGEIARARTRVGRTGEAEK